MPGFLSLRHMAGICAIASVCATLGGCGGGSAGASATGSGSRPSASATSSAPLVTGAAVAGLTGRFCTDFTNLSSHVPTIPPRDKGNLAALQQDSTRLLTVASAYFSALAGESPPQVAGALPPGL